MNMLGFCIGAAVAIFVLALAAWRNRRRTRGPLRITALYCYPLKSGAGLKVAR